MAKQRFRDIKQGRVTKTPVVDESDKKSKSKKGKNRKEDIADNSASLWARLKAFITDSFMLVMPLMYIVFYLVFGGREGFAEHKFTGWLYIILPLVMIQIIFMIKSGDTPGLRAYRLKVVDVHTRERASNAKIVYRQLLSILSLVLFGWISMFFRKDHRVMHELISGTTIIQTDDLYDDSGKPIKA